MANSTSAPETTTTAPPDPRLVAQRLDFWARQKRAFGPTTCGYVNGNISMPVTCSEEDYCMSNVAANVQFCGLPDMAFPATACMDSTAVITSCDTSCLDNISLKKCTVSTDSYCVTMFWEGATGSQPPMSEFSCANFSATWSVISADKVTGSVLTASTALTDGNIAATTYPGSVLPTGGTSSSSSSTSSTGLSRNDIIYIVVGIVGFGLVLSVVTGLVRKYRRKREPQPFYGPAYQNQYQYPPAPSRSLVSHGTHGTWPSSGHPTTVLDYHESRSEVVPEDSVSQVHGSVTLPRYHDLYSQAPTGSVGL